MTCSVVSGDYHTCVYASLQEAARKAKADARDAQRAAHQKEKAETKAHDRAKGVASRAMSEIAPVLTALLPKVLNPRSEETDEFKQLPMLMRTRLRAALTDLKAINTIASDCLTGVRRDVEFDAEYVKTAVAKALELLKARAKARQ